MRITFAHTTAAIVALFLSLPSGAISVCLNDQTYKYNDADGKHRPCSNIRINEERRQTLCLIAEVVENCPQTCGVCCDDDPDFEFPLDNFDKTQDCAWITKNNVDTRRDKYCGMNDRVGSTSIRNMCPKACDFCQEPVGTGAPTISVSPNAEPTRPPSPMPSPFPTLKPTALPSISPSQLPSVTPSDAPSAIPSSVPSNLPSIYPSEAPSNNPTMSLKPSPLPSVAPGAVPVTDAPVATPLCFDDPDFEFELVNFPGTMQDCAWMTKNEDKADKRIEMYCADPVIWLDGCPDTCGNCDSCQDLAGYTFPLKNFPLIEQECSWLTKNENKMDVRRESYCGLEYGETDIGQYCPMSCGFCGM